LPQRDFIGFLKIKNWPQSHFPFSRIIKIFFLLKKIFHAPDKANSIQSVISDGIRFVTIRFRFIGNAIISNKQQQ
jgi:hypothetical protein